MKVAIFGAGNGGCATAVDLALRGFDVILCSAYMPDHLKPIIEKSGLEYSGKLGEGFVKFTATNDVKKTVEVAHFIIITTPSSIHETYAKLLAPYLTGKHLIVLNGCSTGGALNVSKILRRMGVSNPIVCETDILAYICRLQSPTHVRVYHRMNNLFVSSFPSKYNDEVYEIVKKVYPEIELAENVLETSLSNLNAVLHPPGMVLNAGWLESTGGNFLFYSQGITPSVARIIERVDKERLAILGKIGLREISFVEHFHRYGLSSTDQISIYKVIQTSDALGSIKSPQTFNHRYLLEDIDFGLVPMAYIARQINVPTPTIDSLINLASILTDVYHWETGLTAQKLGIEGADLKALKRYLKEGMY